MMNTPGIPSTRWFDATLLRQEGQCRQKDNIKAMMVMGHGGNTVTRMPEAQKGIEKLDLLVVADPHPTTWAALAPERKNNTYLLPIATSYETAGSRTSSNRSIQWGEQIVKPIFESKDDNEVMYLLAKKLGFADRMFKNIKVENNVPVGRGHPARDQSRRLVDRLLRPVAGAAEVAHGEPGRLRHAHAEGHDRAEQGRLLRPAVAVLGHAGVQASRHPLLYNTNLSIKDGGGTFRARFGVEREETLPDGTKRKVSLLGDGSYSKDSEIKDGYPEFTSACSRSSAGTRT